MKKVVLIAILSIIVSIYISPEVLILENGKIIDGKIIKMDEDTMTVITKAEELVIDRDKVIQTFRSMDDYNKFKKSENNNQKTEKGSLIAEWLFSGNVDDTSGNGLNGGIQGKKETAEDRFGNKNSAYEFGRGNSYMLANIRKVNLQNQNFSISVWIKISKFRGTTKIIDLFSWDIKKGYSIMCTSRDSINYQVWLDDGAQKNNSTEINLNNDIWYNLVFIYQNFKAKFFLNGKFINEKEIKNNTDMFNPNYARKTWCYFGYSGKKNPFYPFYGIIDDIRLYNYALSEEKINALYHENGWGK